MNERQRSLRVSAGRGFAFVCASLGAAVMQHSAHAAEVAFFNDTFDSPSASRNNDSNDPADIVWVTRANIGSGFSVVSDAPGIGTGNALQYSPTDGAQVLLAGFDNNVANNNPGFGLPPTEGDRSLGTTPGDTLRLRMNFRFVTKPSLAPRTNNFELGLYGDSDGTVFADASNGGTNDAQGYYIAVGIGTASSGFTLFREDGDDVSSILAGANDRTKLAEDLNGPAIDDTASHILQLEMNRLAGGSVRLKMYVDDVTSPVLTADDANPFSDYNLIAMSESADTTSYRFDNVILDTPEPAGMCILASAGLLMRRRRKRK